MQRCKTRNQCFRCSDFFIHPVSAQVESPLNIHRSALIKPEKLVHSLPRVLFLTGDPRWQLGARAHTGREREENASISPPQHRLHRVRIWHPAWWAFRRLACARACGGCLFVCFCIWMHVFALSSSSFGILFWRPAGEWEQGIMVRILSALGLVMFSVALLILSLISYVSIKKDAIFTGPKYPSGGGPRMYMFHTGFRWVRTDLRPCMNASTVLNYTLWPVWAVT